MQQNKFKSMIIKNNNSNQIKSKIENKTFANELMKIKIKLDRRETC